MMSSDQKKAKISRIKDFAKELCHFYTNLKDDVTCEQCKNSRDDYFTKKYNIRWLDTPQEDLHSREHEDIHSPAIEDINTFTDLIQTPVVSNSNGATPDVIDHINKTGEQVGISCSNKDLCVVIENIESDVSKEQVDSNQPIHKVVVDVINRYVDTERAPVDSSVTEKELCKLVENIDKSTDIIQMPEFSFDDIRRCTELDGVLQIYQNDSTDANPESCRTVDNIQEFTDVDRKQTDSSRKQKDFALENNAKCQDTVPPQMNSMPQYEQSCSQDSKTVSLDDLIVFDFNQQVTNDPTVMYKIVPNSEDPTLFSVQPAFENKLSDFMPPSQGSVALNPCINSEIPHLEVVPDSSISLDDLARQSVMTDYDMKPIECSVLLRDVFSHKRKAKDVPFVFRRVGSKTSAKPTTERVNKKAMTAKIKKEKVTKPKEPRKYKTKNIPKEPRKYNTKGSKKTKLTDPMQTSMELSKENLADYKSLYVNDWLRGTSQVATVYSDIDVNELLKDAIDITDDNIEDDAFELARFMDMEQNSTNFNNLLTNDQNVNNFSDSFTQYLNDRKKTMNNDVCDPLFDYEMVIDQPLDLSIKQTTPSSTDTGFGNDSSLMEQATSNSTYHTIMNNQSPIEDNWKMDVDIEELVTVETNYGSNKRLESQENLKQRVKQKLDRNGFVTTHCQAKDQSVSSPATNFNKSLESRETVRGQLSAVKLGYNGNATMNFNGSNQALSRGNVKGTPSNEKFDQNGSVRTQCYTTDQALSYPATNFIKSLGTQEYFKSQPSKDQLAENGNASIHCYPRVDPSVSCPATNFNKNLGSRETVKFRLSSDKLDDNVNASMNFNRSDQALIYPVRNFNKSLASRGNVVGPPSNEKLNQNGSVTTHCYTTDRALTYPATYFKKSLGSQENFKCQPPKDKLNESANAAEHLNTWDHSLRYPATNFSKSLGTQEYFNSKPSKGQLAEIGNAPIHCYPTVDPSVGCLATNFNKSIESLGNVDVPPYNKKLDQNGSVTTHCYKRNQSVSYPVTNFNKSIGSRETVMGGLSADKLDDNGNASMNLNKSDQSLIYPVRNFNKSLGSRGNVVSAPSNEKLNQNGCVATHCYTKDQALSYPEIGLGSREELKCQPSKDKLKENANASMHFNTWDHALRYPATNFSKSLGSREYFKSQPSKDQLAENGNASIDCYPRGQSVNYLATNFNKSVVRTRENLKDQPSKDKLNENGNASIHPRDQALSYIATNILSKESFSKSCASASSSSKQEDNSRMALDNNSPIRERSSNNLVISKAKQNSMNSTSEYTEPPIVNGSIGQSKLPIKRKWEDELDYETDLDYEPDESGDDDESSQEDIVVQTPLDRESTTVATPSDNNDVATANNNVQQSCNHEFPSETIPTNTNYVATSNNNVQPSWIRDCKSVAPATNTNYAATSSNKVQPSWILDCKSVAATSDNNQLIQPNQSLPPVLKKTPFTPRENFVIKVSNNSSNHVSRAVTLCSPLQVFGDETSVPTPFATPTPVNTTVPLKMQNQKQSFTNPVNVSARPNVPMVAQNQICSWIPINMSNSLVGGGTPYSWNHTNAATTLTNHFRTQMLLMFKRPCFNMLNNKECKSSCTFNHDPLPEANEILPKILSLENDMISYVYSMFVVKSRTSFITYFKMMCEAFGLRKMESALTEAITDCEKYRMLQFFKLIFNGLVTQAGLSKRFAMDRMIKYCNQNAASYTTLIEIMIDTDALYFVDLLTAYYQRGNISEFILKLLEKIKVNPAKNLLQLFIEILAKYSTSNVCDLRVLEVLKKGIKDCVYETGDLHLSNTLNCIMD